MIWFSQPCFTKVLITSLIMVWFSKFNLVLKLENMAYYFLCAINVCEFFKSRSSWTFIACKHLLINNLNLRLTAMINLMKSRTKNKMQRKPAHVMLWMIKRKTLAELSKTAGPTSPAEHFTYQMGSKCHIASHNVRLTFSYTWLFLIHIRLPDRLKFDVAGPNVRHLIKSFFLVDPTNFDLVPTFIIDDKFLII